MQTHTCLHASTCVHVCARAHTHTHTHGLLKVFPVTLSHAQPAFHFPTLKLVTITSCLIFIDDSFVTSLTIAHQAPLSLGFPRQEYWNELSSFSRISSHPRDWTHIFCVGRQILYHWATREALVLYFSSVQSLICVQLFATPWTRVCQAFLSITNSRSLLKLMSIELVMPTNHLNLCWWGWGLGLGLGFS